MSRAYEPFGLHSQLIQAVTTQGFTTPTPIKYTIIPLLLSGQDVSGQIHTGTGKTNVLRPADVVGTNANHAHIPGRTIGAIKIRAEHTILDKPGQFVQQVLAKKAAPRCANSGSPFKERNNHDEFQSIFIRPAHSSGH